MKKGLELLIVMQLAVKIMVKIETKSEKHLMKKKKNIYISLNPQKGLFRLEE